MVVLPSSEFGRETRGFGASVRVGPRDRAVNGRDRQSIDRQFVVAARPTILHASLGGAYGPTQTAVAGADTGQATAGAFVGRLSLYARQLGQQRDTDPGQTVAMVHIPRVAPRCPMPRRGRGAEVVSAQPEFAGSHNGRLSSRRSHAAVPAKCGSLEWVTRSQRRSRARASADETIRGRLAPRRADGRRHRAPWHCRSAERSSTLFVAMQPRGRGGQGRPGGHVASTKKFPGRRLPCEPQAPKRAALGGIGATPPSRPYPSGRRVRPRHSSWSEALSFPASF